MADQRVNDEQVGIATPVETTDRGLFEFKNKDEDGMPIKEETLASELNQKAQVSDPIEAESKDAEEEKKDGDVVVLPRSYSSSSSSSDEEGDDEEKKQRKKERKGLKEKLMEKLPGHTDKVEEDTHVPVEEPHVQEVVYSEPPHQEEEPEKKGFLDKIKEKLPGQNKTDVHHDDAVPVVAEPVVEGEEDKKGFMDKIKDKIPGLSSSKTSDEKNDHDEDK